jgi:CDP-glucose 4,6-dehydratase
MGTIQLLDALRLAGQPCACVVVTSDKCYENREQVWGYRECDPMGGFDPYSASKGCAELATAAMRRSYGGLVRIASGRAGNVIGGGDVAADRLMVDVMRALAEGEPIRVRNPESVRPWQHVLDPLSGYLRLAARLLDSDDPCWQTGWNFGPRAGDELSVRQVVERAISAHGAGTWVDARDPAAPHEAAVLRLAIDKAVAELGWRPRWSADEAIARTAAWHLRVGRDRGAAREACLADIQAYESG